MRPLLSIAWLTIKAAVRFRIFLVMALLLLLAVVGLPLVIKDDGTARGFAQIMMTYTLGTTTVLLGFSTLWIACSSLAREVEECQLQMLDVKPVARWQVWLGKWLGIVALNAALLTLAGGTIYSMILWRANRLPTSPVNERRELFEEVLVARASIREKMPDLEAEAEAAMVKARKAGGTEELTEDQLRAALRERVRAGHQTLPPNHFRRWTIDLSGVQEQVSGQNLRIRVRFFSAKEMFSSERFRTVWEVGPTDKPRTRLAAEYLPAATYQELVLPPDILDTRGQLIVDCSNRSETTLLFMLEDGMEVLYREGGFGLNFVRGLLILLFWVSVLAALGLAAGSGLSFPVAAFVSLSALVVVLSSGLLGGIVAQGTVVGPDEHGVGGGSWVDAVALPAFKAMLGVIKVVQNFSPIESLSTGRSITWGELARAFAQIVLLSGGLLAAIGITIFHRRELAAQGKS